MDINRASPFIVSPQRPLGARPDATERDPARAGQTPVQPAQDAPLKVLASPQQLAEKNREAQALRVQRVNNSESLPLNTQRALASYQQTQAESSDKALGELVGIDVFA